LKKKEIKDPIRNKKQRTQSEIRNKGPICKDKYKTARQEDKARQDRTQQDNTGQMQDKETTRNDKTRQDKAKTRQRHGNSFQNTSKLKKK
jgi:hypothetical protein